MPGVVPGYDATSRSRFLSESTSFPFNWCANAQSLCATSSSRAVRASRPQSAWTARAVLLFPRQEIRGESQPRSNTVWITGASFPISVPVGGSLKLHDNDAVPKRATWSTTTGNGVARSAKCSFRDPNELKTGRRQRGQISTDRCVKTLQHQ